jgi:DNA-binding XRE family transcriptional regulator
MNRIQEFRESLNWSREVLAEKAHVSVPSVYTTEKGKYSTRLSTMRKLAIALGQPIDVIFPDYMIPAPKPKMKGKSKICKWCGKVCTLETHAALVVGGHIIKEYGHEKCLKEWIRTEEYG